MFAVPSNECFIYVYRESSLEGPLHCPPCAKETPLRCTDRRCAILDLGAIDGGGLHPDPPRRSPVAVLDDRAAVLDHFLGGFLRPLWGRPLIADRRVAGASRRRAAWQRRVADAGVAGDLIFFCGVPLACVAVDPLQCW